MSFFVLFSLAEGRDLQVGHGGADRLPGRIPHIQHLVLGRLPPVMTDKKVWKKHVLQQKKL